MSKVLKQFAVSAMAAAVLLLAGCSQSTKPSNNAEPVAAQQPAAPPEPVTAKTAFWPMYTSARSWATDLLTLRLAPKDVAAFQSNGGKAAIWEATFGSPTQRQYRVYSYAIAAIPPDVFKGVTVGEGAPWSGTTRAVMPIDTSVFNIDSDAAYKTASADAADWLKKNPGKKLTSFELGDTYKFPAPVWYAAWGDAKSGGYAVVVDATSGKVLKGK